MELKLINNNNAYTHLVLALFAYRKRLICFIAHAAIGKILRRDCK